MAYDMSRNLETSRFEGLTSETACAGVAGGTLPTGAHKVSSQWHPDWRLTTAIAEPRRIMTLVVLCKCVEQATTDETGRRPTVSVTSRASGAMTCMANRWRSVSVGTLRDAAFEFNGCRSVPFFVVILPAPFFAIRDGRRQ
ncbi:MAG: hypothetical protein EOP37_10735 [Rubrivivax sp.]|nr:MAG: hypothetical protein EOP37_10735 [Rubrivivax sp.]